MKKSIKYAGIAAAALLTVAPIAAPVVANVTTVQAADVDRNSAAYVQRENAADSFASSFNDNVDFSSLSASNVTLGNFSLGNVVALNDFNAKEAGLLSSAYTVKTLMVKRRPSRLKLQLLKAD